MSGALSLMSMGSYKTFVPTLVYDLDAATFTGLSANFNGTTQYLEAYQSAAINGDFTVEGWFYPTNVTGGHTLFSLGSEATYRYIFSLSGTSVTSNFFGGSTTTYTSTVPINTWTHIAVVRSGSTVKVYINGTASATTDTRSGRVGNGAVKIGADSSGAAFFAGNISNFRLVGTTAVYTSNFTPSTVPLTDIAGTQLLLLLNSLTSSNFIDTAIDNGYPITNYNSVGLSLRYPFSATDSTGTYTLTSNYGSSLTWDSANSGSFAKSNSTGTDYIYGGPNYVTSQSYSVFMAYKLSAPSSGRLLNTQSEASKDWLLGGYNGYINAFYPNYVISLPSSGTNTVWNFIWCTWNTVTSLGQMYTATSMQPTGAASSGINGVGGGFNQLRMFSRASGSEVQSGNIAFVKVYNGVLPLSTIQSLHATYKTRFGY